MEQESDKDEFARLERKMESFIEVVLEKFMEHHKELIALRKQIKGIVENGK